MTKAERFARFGELVDQGDAVQVALMESWLDDAVKCQSSHTARGNDRCTVEASYVVHDCQTPTEGVLVCEGVAGYVRRSWGTSCLACKEPVKSCWRLVPFG